MPTTAAAAAAFIARWQGSTASELSTAQSFVIELCDLLAVPRPHPTPGQDYMFERPITFRHGDGSESAGRVDCYRRGAFVQESKKLKAGAQAGQGKTTKGFDDALLRARSQAEIDTGPAQPAAGAAGSAAAGGAAPGADDEPADGAASSAPAGAATARRPWPAELPAQMRAVAEALAATPGALSEAALADRFSGRGPWKKRLPQILQTLEALGRARAEVQAGDRAAWRAA